MGSALQLALQNCDHVNSELLSLQTGRLHATMEHLSNPLDPWQTILNSYFGALHGSNLSLTLNLSKVQAFFLNSFCLEKV